MSSNVLSFETKRMVRNFPALFFGLAFPVMMLGIFGGIYGNEPSELFGGLGTVDVSVPSYIGLVAAVAGLVSFPLGMIELRSRGFLRRLRATPAQPMSFLVAQVIVNAVVYVLGIALLIIVGVLGFGLHAPDNAWAFVGVALLAAAAMFGIGMVIASVAKTEQSALAIAFIIYFPMIFLTGATVPLEVMPDVMQGIAAALPLTYAVDALQWAWTGGSELPGLAFGVLAGTIVVSGAISAWLFRWE